MSDYTQTEQQLLSLAVVMQAALVVERTADYGSAPMREHQALLDSTFEMNPGSFHDIYPDVSFAKNGLKLLLETLSGETNSQNQAVRYSLGIIQLASSLRKDHTTLSALQQRLIKCQQQTSMAEKNTDSMVVNQLADIYVDTLGSFRYRIQVQGNPNYLQNPQTASIIRSILLAGIRAAVLWQQLGGSRWQLLFNRRKLHSQTETLLKKL